MTPMQTLCCKESRGTVTAKEKTQGESLQTRVNQEGAVGVMEMMMTIPHHLQEMVTAPTRERAGTRVVEKTGPGRTVMKTMAREQETCIPVRRGM